MGTLILLNDVSTKGDEAALLVGDTDPAASMKGQDQADLISSYFEIVKIRSIKFVQSEVMN